MSLASALLGELDDAALAELATRLKPYLNSETVDDGWLRGADRIADYVNAPRSRIYALASAKRIPVERDGSALIARKSDLDRWIRQGGGRRP